MGRLMGFWVAILFSVFSFSSTSAILKKPAATAVTCAELAEDLKAMQSAQKQLLQSLAKKNETIAQVLDQNATQLEKRMAKNRTLKRSDLQSLRVSARAFRGHDKRETALVTRFEKASNELLAQVQICLNERRTAKN